MQELRVLVGAHNTAFRAALRRVLACNPELQVVAEASTGAEAIRGAVNLRPDIAILDAHLPDRNGIELAGELRSKAPETRVVVLLGDTGDSGEVYRLAAAQQGATCAVKDRLVEDLPVAIASHSAEGTRGLTPDKRGGLRMITDVKDNSLRTRADKDCSARVNRGRVGHALEVAIVVFLIGTLLLAFAGWLSNRYQQAAIEQSVAVTSDGSSVVVDDLGILGRAGATVRLSPKDRDSYLQLAAATRQRDLTLCVGVGFFALAACSLLLGWREARDAALVPGSRSIFSPPAINPPRHPAGSDA